MLPPLPEFPADWDVLEIITWIIYRGTPSIEALSNDDIERALESLNNAIRTHQLDVRGRPSPSHTEPNAHRARVKIPGDVVDELRRIDALGWCRIGGNAPNFKWLRDPGPFYYDITAPAEAVKRLWPALDMTAAATEKPPPEAPAEFIAAQLRARMEDGRQAKTKKGEARVLSELLNDEFLNTAHLPNSDTIRKNYMGKYRAPKQVP